MDPPDTNLRLTIGNCSVVGGLVEAVFGERIREACQVRLEHLLVDWIIETLALV